MRRTRSRSSALKRTLRSWQIQEEELAAIQAEAERIIARIAGRKIRATAAEAVAGHVPARADQAAEQLALDRTWAELDIVAPMAGVILEKNFTVGDIVDTTHDMFKIADLSRLGVMANVYEEDLPKLVALPPEDRHWEVELLAEPGLPPRKGRFESIGNVIDPMQHTAIVKGWLDNPDGQLRVGQFVTATVELPNRRGWLMVPISSLIDDGSRTYVFVSATAIEDDLTRREVQIAAPRRGHGAARVAPDANPADGDSRSAADRSRASWSSPRAPLSWPAQCHMLADAERRRLAAEPRSHETGEPAMIFGLVRWAVHNRLVVMSAGDRADRASARLRC